MMSLSEAGVVLAMIRRHHGDAGIDAGEAAQFRDELALALPDLTLAEARAAVTRFYATEAGRWMGAADVARTVRAMRRAATPSEWEVSQECVRLGLSPSQAWEYRRQRMLRRGPVEAERVARLAVAPSPVPPSPGALPASPSPSPSPEPSPERPVRAGVDWSRASRGFVGRGLSRLGEAPIFRDMPVKGPSGPSAGRTGVDPSAGA